MSKLLTGRKLRKVSLTLGETSRIEFLRKVQEVASALHGHPAIDRISLKTWAGDSAFTAKITDGGEIGVDGNVFNSTRKTRAEQEAQGWNNVDLCDLAAAHAAYFLATGKNLFGGNWVRARGGALCFCGDGLVVHRSCDDIVTTMLRRRRHCPRSRISC